MTAKNEKIANLIDKANRDLKAADVLLTDEDAEYHSGSICFHCQQCVEKLLKAFLMQKDIPAPRTHDLLYLKELCSDFDNCIKAFDLTNFISFGVEIRYDDPVPSLDEAKAAMLIAIDISNYIKMLLSDNDK